MIPERDELVIESLAGPPRRPTEHETWIAGNQRLRATGLASLGAAQVELAANADLASLGPWLARPSASWNGQLDALVRARRDQDLWNLGMRFTVSDPESTAADGSKMGLGGNLVVGMNGAYAARTDRLELAELSVTAPYLQADGSGVVRDLSSHAAVDLKGSLNPDWGSDSQADGSEDRTERTNLRPSPAVAPGGHDRRHCLPSIAWARWKGTSASRSIPWMSSGCD